MTTCTPYSLTSERRARAIAQIVAWRALRLGLSDQAIDTLTRIARRRVREGRSAASVLDFVRRLATFPLTQIHA